MPDRAATPSGSTTGVYECVHMLPSGLWCGYAQRGPGICPYAHPEPQTLVPLIVKEKSMHRQFVLSESEFAAYEKLRNAANMLIQHTGNRACREGESPSPHTSHAMFQGLIQAVDGVTKARQDAP